MRFAICFLVVGSILIAFVAVAIAQTTASPAPTAPSPQAFTWETFLSGLAGSTIGNSFLAWLIYQKETVAQPAAAKACQEEREKILASNLTERAELLAAFRAESAADRAMFREETAAQRVAFEREASAQRISHEKELQLVLSSIRGGTSPVV